MNSYFCGACNDSFSSCKEISDHLDNCIYAKIFLVPVTLSAFGIDKFHINASKVVAIRKNRNLIEKYVRAVINDLPLIERASLHQDCCWKLYVDYISFKPFENENITKMPTFDEGLEIFLKTYFLEPFYKIKIKQED